jgi:hypothetical protein
VSSMSAFVAYPSRPNEVGSTIRAAIDDLDRYHATLKAALWEQLDIPGRFIADAVLEGIDSSDLLVADITTLNFNVTFEIGFAIGRGKKILLLRYEPFAHLSKELAQQVGIFDTLGYKSYQNSRDLTNLLRDVKDVPPRSVAMNPNQKVPVYLTEDRWRTDGATRIVSRIKKARLPYRSFDPTEQPRLSALDAINQVSQSYGVLVHFVSARQQDAEVSNLRAAFIAGLAQGMRRQVLFLQQGSDPVPLDYRDLVSCYEHPQQIDEFVSDFAGRVFESVQGAGETIPLEAGTVLEKFDLGASSAENELRDLNGYYLPTEGFRRAQRGDVRLVLGRKGSGKTAIFLQVRDKLRSRKTVVLDFKPDGFRLIKFRDRVLAMLDRGSAEHTITAFWELLLLIELTHKIVESEKAAYQFDHQLIEPYRELATAYKEYGYEGQGDFAERMSRLLQRIENDFAQKYGAANGRMLSSPEVTELVYRTDVVAIERALVRYLRFKDSVWILFDNVDKGWASQGIGKQDIVVVKGLIEATRKIERSLQQRDVNAHSLLFLRNDVFELLINDIPDRGKEPRAVLDWTDPDLLRELVRRRAAHAGCEPSDSFAELWASVCVSHVNGEESSQFLIERCLMRPRYLLDLIQHCRGNALTLGHERIEQEDIRRGVSLLSTDLMSDLGHELRDVLPFAEDVIYAFIGCEKEVSSDDINLALMEAKIPDDQHANVVRLLLWYGFLGVLDDENEPRFIYHVNYDVKALDTYRARRTAQAKAYQVNPAFWPALAVKGA